MRSGANLVAVVVTVSSAMSAPLEVRAIVDDPPFKRLPVFSRL